MDINAPFWFYFTIIAVKKKEKSNICKQLSNIRICSECDIVYYKIIKLLKRLSRENEGCIMDRYTARQRAEELVNQMTIEEMASQLRYDAPAIERLDIPEYNWWNEGLHGVARSGTATMFPQAIGLGATFDAELLQDIGDCISTEARAKYNEAIKHEDYDIYKGLTLWSPNVNIFRDPRWGRGHETYGEDPYLSGILGTAFVKGLQGHGEYLKTAACAKHFAVHSGPEAIRHSFDAQATMKDMWETYLPAFEACVLDGQVESVMGAYNRTNGEPCCANEYLMKDVLRGMWNFEGHFVSDCWAVRDFHENHKVTATPEESVKLALELGCDLNCGCTYQRILAALEEGLIDENLIKTAAIRLFTTRFMLGMFDETEYDKIPYEVIECKEHLALAAKAAEESVVLLKNDGILPLKKDELKTIAVIGPNANSRNALIGNYHGTSSRYITVTEGIQDYLGDDVRVLYSQGCHLSKDREEPLAKEADRISEALTVAEHSDLVVLCLGLDETLEGEEGDTGNAYFSGDKDTLEFPESQQILLQAIIDSGVPFVLLVMAGSAMDLNLADEYANAILQTWYPGARGGKQIAEMLFGETGPSGKLPITIYRDLESLPEFTDYGMDGRTYRYIHETPLYPFGYGLTYQTLKLDEVTVAEDFATLTAEGGLVVAKVSNDSDSDAEDVVQVYLKMSNTDCETPHARLAGFARVKVAAKSAQTVEIKLPAKAFTTIAEDGSRALRGDGVSVFVGFGQPDARTTELTGTAPVEIQK